MEQTVGRTVKVVAHSEDHHAVAVAEQLAAGFSGAKRTRRFQPDPTNGQNGHRRFFGQIDYHPEGEESVIGCTAVEVVITAHPEREQGVDWHIVTSEGNPNGRFTTSPQRIMNSVRLPEAITPVATNNRLVVYGRLPKEVQRSNQRTQAANHLAAEITAQAGFRPGLLNFPGGLHGPHFSTFGQWVANGTPVHLISPCCLNCTEDRRRIVSQLSPRVTSLLSRTAAAAFSGLPIHSWRISTFGPDDLELLGEWGIKQVLLPYMWDAPVEQVRADMAQNFRLVQELVAILDATLPFPVTAHQLFEEVVAVDVEQLTKLAYERARLMLPELERNPPKIFGQIHPSQWLARIQQEAFLYLWDTTQHGQLAGTNRPAVICAGLEVHGGYVQGGELFKGPNGEFLPYAWLPNGVRQHWGSWTESNHTLTKERQRLNHYLRHLGY